MRSPKRGKTVAPTEISQAGKALARAIDALCLLVGCPGQLGLVRCNRACGAIPPTDREGYKAFKRKEWTKYVLEGRVSDGDEEES